MSSAKNVGLALKLTIAVAGNARLDFIVVDLRIEHSFNASFEAQLGVVNFATRLDELRPGGEERSVYCSSMLDYDLHPDPEDIARCFLLGCHDRGICYRS